MTAKELHKQKMAAKKEQRSRTRTATERKEPADIGIPFEPAPPEKYFFADDLMPQVDTSYRVRNI
jgi:hypothetical protein